MADERFYTGAVRILYIKDGVDWLPVACLTGNPFNEEVDLLKTTESESDGWETSIPTNQRYSIDFNGIQMLTTGAGDLTKMSYDRLKALKRTRAQIEWKIEETSGDFIDSGYGYIQSINESNEVGALLGFSGSIIGWGVPVFGSGLGTVYIFQDADAFVFQDGNSFIFQ